LTKQNQNRGLGEFADRGFTLERPDDHVLRLMHEGEQIAAFSQAGATEHCLQAECSKHLAIKHGKGHRDARHLLHPG